MDRIRRLAERASTDRAKLDALFDDQLVGTLAGVHEDAPWVVPMMFARDGDRVVKHGSTGAGLLRHAASGAPVALCVTALDALVVAHSGFDSSMNYRSAVIRGRCTELRGADKQHGLDVITDRLAPGRTAEVRPHTGREVAATLVLALPLTDWLYKERTGTASEPDEETDAWSGLVPLQQGWGQPERAPFSDAALPPSVRGLIGR